jgi:hypothetical protein
MCLESAIFYVPDASFLDRLTTPVRPNSLCLPDMRSIIPVGSCRDGPPAFEHKLSDRCGGEADEGRLREKRWCGFGGCWISFSMVSQQPPC